MSPTTAEVTTAELTPGVRIPLVGLGTWPLTGEDAAAAVHQAISNGYRHIDTAENYGNEAAVGEGFRRSGIDRSDLFLTSKFNTQWHSRTGVRDAVGAAMKRLGTDYLDLFLVHWPNPSQGGSLKPAKDCRNWSMTARSGPGVSRTSNPRIYGWSGTQAFPCR